MARRVDVPGGYQLVRDGELCNARELRAVLLMPVEQLWWKPMHRI